VVNPPIIEVTLQDGSIDYRLRTSLLDTRAYGQILAQLAIQIGQMMQTEGNLNNDRVTAEIARFFLLELDKPTAQTTLNQLQ
jgi:hypothetical protein